MKTLTAILFFFLCYSDVKANDDPFRPALPPSVIDMRTAAKDPRTIYGEWMKPLLFPGTKASPPAPAKTFATSATLEFFGANGDDTNADDVAIANALQSSYDTIYGSPGKTYYVNSRKTLWRKAGKVFNGRGGKLYFMPTMPQSSTVGLFDVYATSVDYSTTITVSKGKNTFNTTQTSRFSVGQIVWIKGPRYSIGSGGANYYPHGWYSKVTAINGSEVTMLHPALTSFTGSSLTVYEKVENIHFLNWEIDATTRTGGTAVLMVDVLNSSVKNCHIYGIPNVQSGTGSLFSGIRAHGVGITVSENNVHDGILFSNGGGAYAINAYGQDVLVENNTTENWSSDIVSAGLYQTRTITIRNNIINKGKGRGTAINAHGAGGGLFKANTINAFRTCTDLIQVRYDHTIVEDNIININGAAQSGTGWPAMTNSMNAITIEQNGMEDIIVRNNLVSATNLPAGFDLKDFAVNKMNVTDTTSYSIVKPITNLTIYGNDFGRIHLGSASFAVIGSNIKINNNYLRRKGAFLGTEIYINTEASGLTYQINDNTQVIDGTNATTRTSNGSVVTSTLVPIRVTRNTTSGVAQNNLQYRVSGTYSGTLISLAPTGTTSGNISQSGTNPPVFPTIPALPVPSPFVPAAPTIVSAQFNKVTINLSAATWAVGYKVYRATTLGGLYVEVSSGTVPQGTYIDYTVSPSTTYYYKAVSVNESGQSAQSAASPFVTTPVAALPSAPLAPWIQSTGQTSMTLTLSQAEGAETHNLYRSLTANGTFTLIASGLAAGDYTDNGLAQGTTYYYKSSGVNAQGEGPLSSWGSSTTSAATQLPAQPAAPTFGTITHNSVEVNIPSTAFSASYNIYRSITSGGTYVLIAEGYATGVYTDANVIPETTYYYKVSGVNADGEGQQSAASGPATTLAVPEPPVIGEPSVQRIVTQTTNGKTSVRTKNGKIVTKQ